jgi:hypothetical protein
VYDWVADLECRGMVYTLMRTRWWSDKRHETDTDCFEQAIPLCDTNTGLEVNWCALTTTDAHGQVLYRKSFATTFALTAESAAELVAAGRSRWKIENESNHVSKTKGYQFEHNDRQGLQPLSSLLAKLIILAFLTHTALEWMDDRYRLLRTKLPSRQRLFNDIRTLAIDLCLDRWAALTEFMLNRFDQPPPQPTKG